MVRSHPAAPPTIRGLWPPFGRRWTSSSAGSFNQRSAGRGERLLIGGDTVNSSQLRALPRCAHIASHGKSGTAATCLTGFVSGTNATTLSAVTRCTYGWARTGRTWPTRLREAGAVVVRREMARGSNVSIAQNGAGTRRLDQCKIRGLCSRCVPSISIGERDPKMTIYYQCEMKRGDARTVGWIEERGAKVGSRVELKSADGEFWEVVEVYQPGLQEAQLRAKQANDRNALPSIAGNRT